MVYFLIFLQFIFWCVSIHAISSNLILSCIYCILISSFYLLYIDLILHPYWGMISQHWVKPKLRNVNLNIFLGLYQVFWSFPSSTTLKTFYVSSYITFPRVFILMWYWKYLTHMLHLIHHKIIISQFTINDPHVLFQTIVRYSSSWSFNLPKKCSIID